MPTLVEAREKVRDLSQKALDVVESTTMPAAEQKEALDKIEPDLKHWTSEVRNLEHVEQKRKELFGRPDGHDAAADTSATTSGSLGAQFVNSPQYKALMNRGLKGGRWSSGDIELKTTLTEGTDAAPGPGNALVATPTLLPGIVDIKFPPLVVASLFPSSGTSSPLIRYLRETAVTNAAAPTGEGQLKPESAITFNKVDETLHKVATFLPVSDEMLEDYEQIQGYLDGRLSLFVQVAEEAQVLSGDGTGDNLLGILNRPGLAAPLALTAPDNDMDAIYRQVVAIQTTAFLNPDAIVVNPATWGAILLAKDAQGQYYANGPFVSTQPQTLWGLKVASTPQMPAGQALVGSFAQGGQLFRKGGLVVEASNSHADFFQRDLTAIRAEERLGLAVYRPGAFGVVTGMSGAPAAAA